MAQHTNFPARRAQAQRSAEARMAAVLFNAVKDILAASRTHRVGTGPLTRQQELAAEARRITAACARQIQNITEAYSLAAAKTLGTGTAELQQYLNGNIFGKTTAARNARYLRFFADDIVNMISAAAALGYTGDKILSALRTAYRNPYMLSVITKARKQGAQTADTPSHGKGIYHSAYRNLARNTRGTVALAWGRAEQIYGRHTGATAFRVYRSSSYPCAVCDDEAAYIHHFGDPYPPFHVNCVCGVQFIYERKGGQQTD